MKILFTGPDMVKEAELEAAGHEVVRRYRSEYGRQYIDHLEYKLRKIAREVKPDVIYIPDLWDGRYGYNKDEVLPTRSKIFIVGSTISKSWKGVGSCQCRPNHMNLFVFEADERDEAIKYAKASGRALIWSVSGFEKVYASRRSGYSVGRNAVPWE